MLIASSTIARNPTDQRRDDRHLARGRKTPRHLGAERGARLSRAIANIMRIARRVHRQAAHGDRDRRVDEEHVADGVAQRLLDDVGQAQQPDVPRRVMLSTAIRAK